MKNDLILVALLAFVDFFFSFGVYHFLLCLFNVPDLIVGTVGCGLTIIANFCVLGIRRLK